VLERVAEQVLDRLRDAHGIRFGPKNDRPNLPAA
jgi:hypothetical protein